MQPFSTRFFRPPFFAVALALLAASCLLGACDRHRAEDLPESYGHGSSHQKAYDRHENDSRDGTLHFSDTKGVNPGGEKDESNAAPTPKPGEKASSPMFPGDH